MTTAFRLGSLAQDAVTGIKSLCALVTASSRYMSLESPVGTDYQVPAGKTFYITKMHYSGVDASIGFVIGYGDTGVADGAAAPTNPVQLTQMHRGASAFIEYSADVFLAIPAAKYPYIQWQSGYILLNVEGLEV